MEFRKDPCLPPYSPFFADGIERHSNIESSDQLQNCLTDLHNWLTTNDLLNSTKT